ncbi:MAG: tetratricopeptide repeat protein [Parasulfuritortus sp.]|jgi:tetratricopeptide (TPR) repeat protein|nr:tetratricopeptide repeat protein [Parasulfuritortus sp.]
MKILPLTLALAATLLTTPVFANDAALDQSILEAQHQWERINYEMPADQKAPAFEALAKQEAALVQRYPNRAEPLIWHGIILSSLAGAKGGLGALGLAKEARDNLLASEKIDPTAMLGSADTSLGTLYFKVPGWPIGFGDDDKAEAYLKQALQINPNGIDPNYFYADFLYGKKRYPEAMQALEKAMAAAPRPNRPLADKGRRQEIQALMTKVREKAGDSLKSAER